MNKPEFHIVSFSGGKDSTAMLLHMIELNMKIDDIVFCDTGLEFPGMYKHIDKVESYIGRKITRLKADRNFEWYAFERKMPAKNDQGEKDGFSWPDMKIRWCTFYLKREPKRQYEKALKEYSIIEYVGIAADEGYRLIRKNNQQKNHRHPLVDWGWPEAQCLKYCYDHGFDWGGLYRQFARLSCWCCPLQRLAELRNLRHYHPALWQKLREWDKKTWRSFRPSDTVEELEIRFAAEDLQQSLFGDEANG